MLFEGTLRKVVVQAGVCNVLEEHYTAEVYEKLKANQDRPLDFLRADGWVRAEHPPRTNWSGPEAPPDPLLRVKWGDYYELVQMPYGMRLRDSKTGPRTVPLSPAAGKVVADLPSVPSSPSVFRQSHCPLRVRISLLFPRSPSLDYCSC